MTLDIEGTLSAHVALGDEDDGITQCSCGTIAVWRRDSVDDEDEVRYLPTHAEGPDLRWHVAHVAAVLREQIEGAIIATTVGALQYAAGLASSLENDELAAQLYDAARNTEAQDPADWWCCPVCEEMTCDDGCPLEPIRAAHLSDTERAGGAG